MPTVRKLRDFAGIPSLDQRGQLAWDAATKAISSHGYYQSVDFQDRRINATINSLGGWCRFCEASDDAEEFSKWVRHRFLETYQRFDAIDVHSELCGPLLGYYRSAPTDHKASTEARNPVLAVGVDYAAMLPEFSGGVRELAPVSSDPAQITRLLKKP